MRLVVPTGPGQVELNFMWLPTFIGMNTILKAEIEDKLGPVFHGRDLTEDTLEEMHDAVLDLLEDKFPPLKGLRDYLDGVKFVEVVG